MIEEFIDKNRNDIRGFLRIAGYILGWAVTLMLSLGIAFAIIGAIATIL